jgi:hypothetical protein
MKTKAAGGNKEVAPMSVFLALALVTGPPLNVILYEYPELPPLAICHEKLRNAMTFWRPLEDEALFREAYDPNKDNDPMRALWLRDRRSLNRWRGEARVATIAAAQAVSFWKFACIAQSSAFESQERAKAIAMCRDQFKENRWQPGGWRKK